MLAKTELSPKAKTLMAMADYIEKNGWCQGKRKSQFGKVCLLGAYDNISIEKDNNALLDLSNHLHFMVLGKHSKYAGTDLPMASIIIMSWNDNVAKTEKEVVDTLRELAYSID